MFLVKDKNKIRLNANGQNNTHCEFYGKYISQK